jgi:hypothetical protein
MGREGNNDENMYAAFFFPPFPQFFWKGKVQQKTEDMGPDALMVREFTVGAGQRAPDTPGEFS